MKPGKRKPATLRMKPGNPKPPRVFDGQTPSQQFGDVEATWDHAKRLEEDPTFWLGYDPANIKHRLNTEGTTTGGWTSATDPITIHPNTIEALLRSPLYRSDAARQEGLGKAIRDVEAHEVEHYLTNRADEIDTSPENTRELLELMSSLDHYAEERSIRANDLNRGKAISESAKNTGEASIQHKVMSADRENARKKREILERIAREKGWRNREEREAAYPRNQGIEGLLRTVGLISDGPTEFDMPYVDARQAELEGIAAALEKLQRD